MANRDTIYGLKYVGNLTGNATGQVIRCNIPASNGTAVFIGDAVKSLGASDDDGVPQVIQCAAGDIIYGVVVGFEPNLADLSVKHRVASTNRYCLVEVDPMAVFEVQEDSVGGALTTASVGLNADLIVATGSTASGLSGMELDSSTANTTNTLRLRILGFSQRVDNEIGTNAKVLVKINGSEFGNAIAGV